VGFARDEKYGLVLPMIGIRKINSLTITLHISMLSRYHCRRRLSQHTGCPPDDATGDIDNAFSTLRIVAFVYASTGDSIAKLFSETHLRSDCVRVAVRVVATCVRIPIGCMSIHDVYAINVCRDRFIVIVEPQACWNRTFFRVTVKVVSHRDTR
jgi:hypothetical protein